ncbi:hypothetical protein DYH09_20620 [bacterium CPR1]|nr:hypothetical protein [bacterium CPR1]
MFKPKGAQAVARAGQLYQAGKKAEALQMALSGGKADPTGWTLAATIALEGPGPGGDGPHGRGARLFCAGPGSADAGAHPGHRAGPAARQ